MLFFDEYNEQNITDEDLDDGENDSIIHFSAYNHQGRGAKMV